MEKSYSVEALNDLAALSRVFIKYGGELSELPNSRSVWFVAKIGNCPASGTDSRVDTLEPSDGFFRDMATLADNLERVLVKPADRHRASPGAGAWEIASGRVESLIMFCYDRAVQRVQVEKTELK